MVESYNSQNPGPESQSAKDKLSNKELFQNARTYWWTYSSFAFAGLVTFIKEPDFLEFWKADLIRAFDSGLLGLFIAFVIYALWKIDRRFGKIPKPDRVAENLIGVLGVILWLVWMSISQIIMIAEDEVKQPEYNTVIEQSESGGKHTSK